MENDPKRYLITEAALAAAFTEWDRRYREEPERFESEAVHLLKGTPETYGEECAPYLISILEEQHGLSKKSSEQTSALEGEDGNGANPIPPPPGQTSGPGQQ